MVGTKEKNIRRKYAPAFLYHRFFYKKRLSALNVHEMYDTYSLVLFLKFQKHCSSILINESIYIRGGHLKMKFYEINDGQTKEWSYEGSQAGEYAKISFYIHTQLVSAAEIYAAIQPHFLPLQWKANDSDICAKSMEECYCSASCKKCLLNCKKKEENWSAPIPDFIWNEKQRLRVDISDVMRYVMIQGLVLKCEIKNIAKILDDVEGLEVSKAVIRETIYDISDQEYVSKLQDQKEEARQKVLNAFSTADTRTYKQFFETCCNLLKDFALNRMNEDGHISWIAYKFIASIAEDLADEGFLERSEKEGLMRRALV